jgi:DNA-directed RNA polymerase subunit RPC12/RpoP
MPATHTISCPCCKEPLASCRENGNGTLVIPTRHIEQEQGNAFLRCSHCGNRIALASVPDCDPAQWKLSSIQTCIRRVYADSRLAEHPSW